MCSVTCMWLADSSLSYKGQGAPGNITLRAEFACGLLGIAAVQAMQLSEGLGQCPGVAHHAGGRAVAVSEMFEHLLARQAPRKLTVTPVHIRTIAIPYMQHQILSAL